MSALQFMIPGCVYIDIGPASLKALHGDVGIEVPLERAGDGRLTRTGRAQLTEALRAFVNRKGWQPRLRAYCAIGARGVTLRRIALPPSTKDQLRKVVLLQIESEFPLPPDELAWGFRPLDGRNQPADAGKQDVLVAAVKKEVVEEYSEVLGECGLIPAFTVAALARSFACSKPDGPFAALDVGRSQSEWVSFDEGAPLSVRIISWGKQSLERTVAERLGVSLDEAGRILARPELATAEHRRHLCDAVNAALDSLAGSLNGTRNVRRLFLSGDVGSPPDMLLQLCERLGGVVCERIEVAAGEGRSAAILGLQKYVEQNGGSLPLALQVRPGNGASALSRPAPTKWVKIAVALAASALLLPYAEAAVMKWFLSKRMSALNAQTNTLATIDSEFAFLQYLKKNQPPYLDALYLLSRSAPAGTRFDAVTMNRRGELSLRCALKSGEQAVDFRSKLIGSGFFSTVVLEEQTPTPDRQKVNVRLSAQWKAEPRPTLKVEPLPKDPSPAGIPSGAVPSSLVSSGPLPPDASPVAVIPAGSLPSGGPLIRGAAVTPGMTPPSGVTPPGSPVIPESSPSTSSRGRTQAETKDQ